jgi:PAS domain S-box-containing protein
MDAPEKINILVVDDQAPKLLTLETILGDLHENVLQAHSAEEALRLLLAHEIAIVLVDVCMPGMDGFELAELVRQHPRCRQTAIIFISAVHLSDADRLRGYHLGAVDYIPVPIIPQVLRAKVAVFAELYRKRGELERLNKGLEQRVSERTRDLEATNARLRASERRYRELVQALPAAVYTCDDRGRVTLYNQAAVDLWGCEPDLAADDWCSSRPLYHADGSAIPPGECPLALTLRDGVARRGKEVVIERPDGTRRSVLTHPEAILDEQGRIVGAINMLVDTTEHRAAQQAVRESELKFRAMADNIAQMAWMADGTGSVTWCNQRWFEYTGLGVEASLGWGWTATIHPEHAERVVRKISACFRSGDAWEDTFPTRGADEGYRWFLCRAFPVRAADGRVERWFGTGTDITEQREAQQVLARDRETLEKLVAERTAQLERSNEKLRIADRMAMIGTLSAGLGHDMANLLLPVRMRLDAVDACDMPAEAREDIAAIRSACDYLQRLAGSLRLLAIDPEKRDARESSTDIGSWWEEAEAMIRNGIVRPATLETRLARGLPPVSIGRAALTQVVFNLVQNAGEAMRGRADARVVVSASLEPGGSVRLSVSDNGPGMDEATRGRCMEPFFTTKTRGLSTGLGLALVAGLVKGVGGSIEIASAPGQGAAFHLLLPVPPAAAPEAPGRPSVGAARRRAALTIGDQRLGAFLGTVLREAGFEPEATGAGDVGEDVWLWVTDAPDDARCRQVRDAAARGARVLVISGRSDDEFPGATRLDSGLKPSRLGEAVRAHLHEPPSSPVVVSLPHALAEGAER